MNVSNSQDAVAAMRTLDPDDRLKVLSWLDQLGNWENDKRLREMAKATASRNIFALNTPDDIRIFFTINETLQQIVVVDLAKPSRFKTAVSG